MQPTPTFPPAGSRSPTPLPRRSPLSLVLLLAGPLALFGCRNPKVAVYQVPKESEAPLPNASPDTASAAAAAPAPAAMPPGMPAMPPMPGATGGATDPHALQTASGADLAWTAPAAWQSKQGSMMRKATYVIAGENGAAPAELAVTAFPGDVGGEVANVNRWRGQVGLPEVPDAAASASIQRLEAHGLKIGVVDVVAAPGANASRLVGAMVPFQGATWFFKLTGPDATVAKAKPAFLEFLQTVKPAAPTP
ncbi:MAG TPA: hypothetical protein VHE61_15845 [Opitutaceae bacterium]|nr:hypothetical protein [Opitutaceae bacterium]